MSRSKTGHRLSGRLSNNQKVLAGLLLLMVLGGLLRFSGLEKTGPFFVDQGAYMLGAWWYSEVASLMAEALPHWIESPPEQLGSELLRLFRRAEGQSMVMGRPFHELLGAIPISVAGYQPYRGNMVSAFFGILSVPALLLLYRKLYGPRGSLAATALLALMGIHVYYSRNFFPEADSTFFLLLSFIFYMKSREKAPEARTADWAALRARVLQVGMRNSNCMAIAPTATISNIVGVSQSIEPTYQNLFVKSNLSGEFTVVNEHLVRDLKKLGLWDEVMVADLKYFDGSLAKIDRLRRISRQSGEGDVQALLRIVRGCRVVQHPIGARDRLERYLQVSPPQLGGTPLLDPRQWFEQSPCAYDAPDDAYVSVLLDENIAGEQCAISVYKKMIDYTKDKDQVTADMALKIMEDRAVTSLVVMNQQSRLSGLLHLHDLWRTEMI